jgi:predicted Zn-dependent protease
MEPDVNQQILAEVRGVRRLIRRWAIAALVLFVLFLAASVWRVPSQSDPYAKATAAMKASDYSKALSIVEPLAVAHPENYYHHEYLGTIYLALGNPAKAEEEYSKAYALYPSESLANMVATVRERLRLQSATPHLTPGATP